MKKLKLALIGFGNVGKEFVRILLEKKDEWSCEFDYEFLVTAISTRSRGCLVDPMGIDLNRALNEIESQGKFSKCNPAYSNLSTMEIIEADFTDIVVEITTLNIDTGQPAIDHIRSALNYKKHVITTNKGPIAHAYEELKLLAEMKKRHFMFEGTVMDGAPVFNLVRETLIGCDISAIEGIFNGTTNFILSEMDRGQSFDSALKTAQSQGWVEANPSMDIDGWDAVAKVTSLMNVLMGANITPQDIECIGISHITAEDLVNARKEGKTIKLLCQGYKKEDKFIGKVAPALIPLDHPLAQVRGTTTTVTFKTDFAGDITVEIKDPKIRQTAYAVIIDLLTIAKRI